MAENRKPKGEQSYQLKDKEAGFFDDETGLDITRDQVVKIGDGAGKKTLRMIRSGGLLEVNMEPKPPTGFDENAGANSPSSASSEGGNEEDADEKDELAEDFPHRSFLVSGGYTSASSVRDASDEDLLKVEGIGEGRLKEIRAALK